MAQRKNEDMFEMRPLSPGTRLPSTGRALVPHTQNRPLSRRERKTEREGEYQELVIQLQARKTELGQRTMARLTRSSVAITVETALDIWEIKNSVQDPELRILTDRVCIEGAKMTAVYEEEATAAGNNQILVEIERSPRVVLPPRRGLRAWFSGSDEDE